MLTACRPTAASYCSPWSSASSRSCSSGGSCRAGARPRAHPSRSRPSPLATAADPDHRAGHRVRRRRRATSGRARASRGQPGARRAEAGGRRPSQGRPRAAQPRGAPRRRRDDRRPEARRGDPAPSRPSGTGAAHGDRAPQLRDGRAARRARWHRAVARRAHRRLAHRARRLPLRSTISARSPASGPRDSRPSVDTSHREAVAGCVAPALAAGLALPAALRVRAGRLPLLCSSSPVSQRCDCGCPAGSASSAPCWRWASAHSCRSRTCDRSRTIRWRPRSAIRSTGVPS